eukprot:COSAG05_NODE_4235_length_1611_cov_2.677910_1_plen_66_part_00
MDTGDTQVDEEGKEYKREYLVRYRGYDPEDSLWHNDEHLKKQAPKVLKKYLKDIGEQKTYKCGSP